MSGHRHNTCITYRINRKLYTFSGKKTGLAAFIIAFCQTQITKRVKQTQNPTFQDKKRSNV